METFVNKEQQNLPKDEYLMKIARRRVGFQKHVIVYLLVCSVISIICLIEGGKIPFDLWWAWGIGLGIHGISAYGFLFDERKAAEREYQKLQQELREK
ncbi:2TM domain-containing protein [Runella sp. MFBS21]|uniref:2TM domain-containing protein n=1 Tax=Runella sp. MFBS21 TaxID=3034018 RepID=UPI0023F63CEB|nr:2TM domain-containing protein [Runella sp. MFBS21]MDF7819036.1 2TM domain-containing protein [Runella sp. MFBS21]